MQSRYRTPGWSSHTPWQIMPVGKSIVDIAFRHRQQSMYHGAPLSECTVRLRGSGSFARCRRRAARPSARAVAGAIRCRTVGKCIGTVLLFGVIARLPIEQNTTKHSCCSDRLPETPLDRRDRNDRNTPCEAAPQRPRPPEHQAPTLRSSHPTVCAQIAGPAVRSCGGSRRSAAAPERVVTPRRRATARGRSAAPAARSRRSRRSRARRRSTAAVQARRTGAPGR
jgi:hypothetical protein